MARTGLGDVGPKGGKCPYCQRETGSLKLHTPACKDNPEGTGWAGSGRRSRTSVHAVPDYAVVHTRSRPAPLLCGPLHGYLLPPTRGPRPHYLDDSGEVLPTRVGDNVMRGQSKRRIGIYVLRREGDRHFWYVWIPSSRGPGS